MADFDHIVSRSYKPSAEMCCEKCVFDFGEHKNWCDRVMEEIAEKRAGYKDHDFIPAQEPMRGGDRLINAPNSKREALSRRLKRRKAKGK